MSAYESGDGLVLASLDVLGDDGELHERARAELRAADRDSGPADGEGQTAIRVTVSAQGLVEDVSVSRDWRAHVEPSAFADTLFQAYAAALGQLVNASALRAFAAYEQTGDRRPGSAGTAPTASGAPPAEPRVWLASVWDTLRELDDTLHRLERGQGTDARTVTDPYGHLTATCRGGQVTAVTGDARRIGAADPQQLRAAALAVFRAAQRGDQA